MIRTTEQKQRAAELRRKSRLANPGSNTRYSQRWQAAHRVEQHEMVNAWRRRTVGANAAHCAVARAIKRGDLIRPEICGRCGSGGRIEASHDDYSRPLDVEWLCRRCHADKDLRIKET